MELGSSRFLILKQSSRTRRLVGAGRCTQNQAQVDGLQVMLLPQTLQKAMWDRSKVVPLTLKQKQELAGS
jgi:hypothetical protein